MDPILAELIRYALNCNCSGYEHDQGEPELTDEQWATLYATAVEQGFIWPLCGRTSSQWRVGKPEFGPCTLPQQHPGDHQDARGQSREAGSRDGWC